VTTWVYRDGILVADSMVTTSVTSQIVGTCKKVHKTKSGILCAGAGNLVDLHKFFRWVDEGMQDDVAKLDHLDGILVKSKDEIYQVDNELFPYVIEAPWYAGGAGDQLAIGAMAMGATAEEALKVAMKYSMGTGGKIQKVTL
jgi:hypothetical protein